MAQIPRVFIGHLAREARPEDIRELLRKFSDIRDVAVKDGFGFAEFGTIDEAERCVREMHDSMFMGERIVVELARGTRRERGDTSEAPYRNPRIIRGHAVLIENCPDVSWQALKDHMRQCGSLRYADVYPDRREGIVEFLDRRDMKRAIEHFDRTVFHHKEIYLREYTGASSRSRSRTRSRSRSRDGYDRKRYATSRSHNHHTHHHSEHYGGYHGRGGSRSRSHSRTRGRSPAYNRERRPYRREDERPDSRERF